VAALCSGCDEAQELGRLLAGPPLDDDQVQQATWLVEACEARTWTANQAKAHLDAALRALERVRINPMAHRELADLAAFVVEREA
jgi:geranylgeranyl pyrophosphate synthase